MRRDWPGPTSTFGVTRYILEQGSVDPAIDIFHRWPGAFAFGAYLSNLLGIDDPTAFAAWAQLFFAVVLAVLVYACARSLSTNVRAAWIAVVLFSFTNWAGQLYYAPQPLALVLSLAILLLIIRFLRGPANRTRTVDRGAGWAGRPSTRICRSPRAASNRVRAVVLTCVLALQFASTISHQLTPVHHHCQRRVHRGARLRAPVVDRARPDRDRRRLPAAQSPLHSGQLRPDQHAQSVLELPGARRGRRRSAGNQGTHRGTPDRHQPDRGDPGHRRSGLPLAPRRALAGGGVCRADRQPVADRLRPELRWRGTASCLPVRLPVVRRRRRVAAGGH